MKLLGILVGLACSWALNKWAPALAADFAAGRLPTTAIAAVATILSVLWGTAYGRMSSFEKLDDLSADQRELVLARVRRYKERIIGAITWNAVLAAIALIANEFVKLPSGAPHAGSWLTYLLLAAIGFWAGGLVQSRATLRSVEASRDAMFQAQAAERAKRNYLSRLRADAASRPMDQDDAHLAGYSGSTA